MKTIPSDLAIHLNQEVTTLCSCWKVVRTDGAIFTFTDHDEDIVFEARTYLASTGFNRTNVSSSENLTVDNLEVVGVLDSETITKEELKNGVFDYATIEVFMINWADPTMGRIIIRTGFTGEIIITNKGIFKAELRGLTQQLNYNFGEVYQPICRTDLGSTKCSIDIEALSMNGTITYVVDGGNFLVAGPTGVTSYYDQGVLKFLTGRNTGKAIEVRAWNLENLQVITFLKFPGRPEVGDTFRITPGCNRTLAVCRDKFSNAINFRGEPHVPSPDIVFNYPNART